MRLPTFFILLGSWYANVQMSSIMHFFAFFMGSSDCGEEAILGSQMSQEQQMDPVSSPHSVFSCLLLLRSEVIGFQLT